MRTQACCMLNGTDCMRIVALQSADLWITFMSLPRQHVGARLHKRLLALKVATPTCQCQMSGACSMLVVLVQPHAMASTIRCSHASKEKHHNASEGWCTTFNTLHVPLWCCITAAASHRLQLMPRVRAGQHLAFPQLCKTMQSAACSRRQHTLLGNTLRFVMRRATHHLACACLCRMTMCRPTSHSQLQRTTAALQQSSAVGTTGSALRSGRQK